MISFPSDIRFEFFLYNRIIYIELKYCLCIHEPFSDQLNFLEKKKTFRYHPYGVIPSFLKL